MRGVIILVITQSLRVRFFTPFDAYALKKDYRSRIVSMTDRMLKAAMITTTSQPAI